MNALKALAGRHPLASYFVLAFAVSWSSVFLVIGGPAGVPGTKEETDRLFPFVYLAMLSGPISAGLLSILLTQEKGGLRELWSRLVRRRVGARWYAVACLAAPVLTTTVLLSLSLLSRDFVPGIFTTADKLPLLLFGLIVALGAGVFEELGWTGFVTPRLRRRHGVLASGLFLGMTWGAWHLLVNLWASGTPGGGISGAFMLPVLLSTLGLGMLPAYRVLMVWVYDRTGSLLIGMLMHVSLTGSLIILRPAATGMGLVLYELTWAGTLWAVMAVAIVGTARRRLSRGIGPGAARLSPDPRLTGRGA
jgi:membrane protease YdiL (CAAX protease family)